MGETKHDGLAVPGRVVLAHEPPFALGSLRVDPPTREVTNNKRRETLEPRVMQALVALVRAQGTVVTRDELIERCWDGRIVTDDAINRVLSRIRHVADDIGGRSFRLETITKVGYRLAAAPLSVPRPAAKGAGSEHGSLPLVERRTLVAAAAALVVTASATGILWRQPWRHRPPPEASELYRRGDIAYRTGTPEQMRQAESFFERAVAIDPLFAEAWGALALTYTHNLEGYAKAEAASIPGRIRAAAGRALELEPDNADAQLALVSITPAFRNWGRIEPVLRGLCDRFPRHWLAHGRTAILLYQVGRFDDGIPFHRKVIELDPMMPGPFAFLSTALSNAGRLQEADSVLRQAHDRWPAHPLLWFAKYNHLLFTGRPRSATAFIQDPEALPPGFGPAQIEPRLTLARAVDTRREADIESSAGHYRQMALADAASIAFAAPVFALLGDLDLTFASLERYYLNRGSFGPEAPIGPYTRRHTDVLFTPPMAAARADPRFARLTRAVGLDAYWQSVGITPPHLRS